MSLSSYPSRAYHPRTLNQKNNSSKYYPSSSSSSSRNAWKLDTFIDKASGQSKEIIVLTDTPSPIPLPPPPPPIRILRRRLLRTHLVITASELKAPAYLQASDSLTTKNHPIAQTTPTISPSPTSFLINPPLRRS